MRNTRRTPSRPRCTGRYGPIQMFVQPASDPEAFIVTVSDTRSHTQIFRQEARGTYLEAQRCALLVAKENFPDEGCDPEWREGFSG